MWRWYLESSKQPKPLGHRLNHCCPTRESFLFPVFSWSFPLAESNQKLEGIGSHWFLIHVVQTPRMESRVGKGGSQSKWANGRYSIQVIILSVKINFYSFKMSASLNFIFSSYYFILLNFRNNYLATPQRYPLFLFFKIIIGKVWKLCEILEASNKLGFRLSHFSLFLVLIFIGIASFKSKNMPVRQKMKVLGRM